MAIKPRIRIVKPKEYNAESIKVLKGLDGVRAKPTMYIGNTDKRGVLQICKEILDNSVDEHVVGHGNIVQVRFDSKTQQFTVIDNGRGIPVEKHKDTGISTLTTILTLLHAGGKLDASQKGYDGGKGVRGVHGVGISVTNALATIMEVWTCRSKKWYYQKFQKGVVSTKVIQKNPPLASQPCGTIIRIIPDFTIFKNAKLAPQDFFDLLDITAYLHSKLKILFIADGKKYKFYHPSGTLGLISKEIKELNTEKIGKPLVFNSSDVSLVMQWTAHDDEAITTYVNGSKTNEGGTHLLGLNRAIAEAFAKYKTAKSKFRSDELRIGLFAILNFNIRQPQFENQIKSKLANPEATDIVVTGILPVLTKHLKENPTMTKEIIRRANDFSEAKEVYKINKKAAAQLKNVKKGRLLLPPNLSVSKTTNPKERELFLTEGESAAGCFFGSTRIRLLNGESKTLKQLVKDREKNIINYTYAHCSKTNTLHVVPITQPRLVKYTKYLTEITLDNGKKIKCTRSHEWKLRDGFYCKAEDLTVGTSLMPLYEKIKETKSGPRRMVWHPYPSDQNANPTIKNKYKGRWEFVYSIVANDSPCLSKCKTILNNAGEKINVHHKEHLEVEIYSAAFNHKVVSVRNITLKNPVPVYDASIYKYKNYALDAGVFVHNTARVAKDDYFQEVLTLKGKPPNAYRVKPIKLLNNAEIINILKSIGYDPSIKDSFNNLRVGKIILLADPDPDGCHIEILLTGLIFKYLKPLIDQGRIYTVEAPLFVAQHKGNHIYGDSLQEILKQVPPNFNKNNIVRMKGLGEMNDDVLQKFAFNPATRKLKRLCSVSGSALNRFVNMVSSETDARKVLLGVK